MKIFSIVSLFLISCASVEAAYESVSLNSKNISYNNHINFFPLHSLCTLYGLCVTHNTSLPIQGNVLKKTECKHKNKHHSLGKRVIHSSKKVFDKRLCGKNGRQSKCNARI